MKGGHYMSVKAIESHLFPPLVSAEVISADGSEIITGSGPASCQSACGRRPRPARGLIKGKSGGLTGIASTPKDKFDFPHNKNGNRGCYLRIGLILVNPVTFEGLMCGHIVGLIA
jgi:hypothetical protein